jgi:hypothetical protein
VTQWSDKNWLHSGTDFYFKKTLATTTKEKKKGFPIKIAFKPKVTTTNRQISRIINLDLPPQTLDLFRVSPNCENGGH